MEDLSRYRLEVELRDRTPAVVRAIRPEDKDDLRRGFDQLSPHSIYHRFFQAKRELTDADLRYLTEVDFVTHVGLVVEVEVEGEWRVIGVARFVRVGGVAGSELSPNSGVSARELEEKGRRGEQGKLGPQGAQETRQAEDAQPGKEAGRHPRLLARRGGGRPRGDGSDSDLAGGGAGFRGSGGGDEPAGSGEPAEHADEGGKAGGRAEVAFTVGDEFQGRGVATLLLEHLSGIAWGLGYRIFEAEVMPENRQMLEVFEHSGLAIRERVQEGLVHVELALG